MVVSFLVGAGIGVFYALRSEAGRPQPPPAETLADTIQRILAEERRREGGAKRD